MRNFLLLVFLFCSTVCFAQPLRFTHYDTRQGLPQNSVHALLQDREGFIWMGTQDGLSRFDGYSFTVYRHNHKDSTSLTDNFVVDLSEDSAGNIWVGTRSGLCVFLKSKNCFIRFKSPSANTGLHHPSAFFCPSGKGMVLSIVPLGLCMAEVQNDKIVAKPFPPYYKRIWKQQNKYIIRRNDSLFVSASLVLPLKYTLALPVLLVNYINDLEYAADGIYFSAIKSLYHISPSGITKKIADLPDNINCLSFDKTGRMWIGTENSLWLFQPSSGSLKRIETDAANPFSLNSSQILSLMCDRQGVMWVGTSGGGVNMCDAGREFFKVYSSAQMPGFPPGAVWAAAESNTGVILGTEKGVISIPENAKAPPQWLSLVPKDVFATQLCFDRQGKLWVGTRNSGIICIDTALRKREWIDTTNSELSDNSIFHISSPADSQVIITTRHGLNIFNPQTGAWRVYYKSNNESGLPNSYIIHAHSDARQTLWLAHPMGLTRLSGNTFYNYHTLANDTTSLPFDVVSYVSEGSSNTLWISTLGGGVARFYPEQQKFVTFNTTSGLPNDVVYAAVEDKQGILWMSTNEGICRLDPLTGFIEVFTIRDGLPSNEFVQNSAYRFSNGHLGFGSVDGWVSFDPAAHSTLADTLHPVLAGLYINNQPVPCFGLEQLMLDHETRNVAFSFTAVNYRVQEKIRYSCMLEGFDAAWIEQAPGQRMISYTNLPFGDYVFKVRVRVGNGPWQENMIEIPLHVVPPFWMRTWFYVLMAVLAALLLAGIVAWIARQNYRRKMRVLETEHKIHIERERISRDLHDNIGAQITYIVSTLDFLSFRLEKQTPVENRRLIHELGQNARHTMDQLRETIWAMNQPALGIDEFVQKLRNFAQQAGSSGNMQMQVEHHAAGLGIALAPAQVLHLYRIIQEAVNNAIKHANATQLDITLLAEAGKLVITISDNGCGFDPGQNRDGHYGLANMRTRAAEIGAGITLSSQPGSGTEIRITLPVNTVNDVLHNSDK
ncbi:MAG: ATP-binding protein [Bacteroidia bacterium]|jgi:signal transduction histidine kinase/ligand-binding sensor domain-containing protein|nr:ATP-binding protein [Bacteroidia bacterium]